MQNDEPVWLTPERIIDINIEVVAETHEPHFLRDLGLLDSAAARPRQQFSYGEADIVTLAFVLLEAIAQNHPFGQGNKRTALLAAIIMLQQNGYDFAAPDGDELGKLVEQLVEGKNDLADFIESVRSYVAAR